MMRCIRDILPGYAIQTVNGPVIFPADHGPMEGTTDAMSTAILRGLGRLSPPSVRNPAARKLSVAGVRGALVESRRQRFPRLRKVAGDTALDSGHNFNRRNRRHAAPRIRGRLQGSLARRNGWQSHSRLLRNGR